MLAGEMRVRRRGFFLHSDTGESDAGDHDAPEGVVVRPPRGQIAPTHGGGSRGVPGARFSSAGHPRGESDPDDVLPAIRSGSVTGIRQRAHSPR
jgi:hypothetical protein